MTTENRRDIFRSLSATLLALLKAMLQNDEITQLSAVYDA